MTYFIELPVVRFQEPTTLQLVNLARVEAIAPDGDDKTTLYYEDGRLTVDLSYSDVRGRIPSSLWSGPAKDIYAQRCDTAPTEPPQHLQKSAR